MSDQAGQIWVLFWVLGSVFFGLWRKNLWAGLFFFCLLFIVAGLVRFCVWNFLGR